MGGPGRPDAGKDCGDTDRSTTDSGTEEEKRGSADVDAGEEKGNEESKGAKNHQQRIEAIEKSVSKIKEDNEKNVKTTAKWDEKITARLDALENLFQRLENTNQMLESTNQRLESKHQNIISLICFVGFLALLGGGLTYVSFQTKYAHIQMLDSRVQTLEADLTILKNAHNRLKEKEQNEVLFSNVLVNWQAWTE